MGRGKIEIKRIDNSTNRQVTFSKRKNGILKKAREINVLCEAEVSLIVFSSTGKMAEFCSPNSSLIKILDKYQKGSGRKLWDAKHEYLNSEVERVKKENDNMQIELRHLKGEDLTSLTPKELIPIEEALSNGLSKVKERQSEIVKVMKKNGRMLEEENKHLNYILLKTQQMEIHGNARDLENEYQHNRRDYPSTIPFAFHIQPIQPNLQEH
uniref:PISTILLATA-like protein 2 n=1 Tax=Nigella damascena TaxID=3444 RepID=A0A0S1YYL3_NIGDA|nr:PISTILLATA-like protein 2 [Nigella damascena]